MKRSFAIILSLAVASASMVATADMSYAKSRKQTCARYAQRQADNVVNRNVGTGAVLGGGTGLLIGGLSNGGRGLLPGLAIGAIGGGVVGAISGTEKRKRVYRAAYYDCMNNY